MSFLFLFCAKLFIWYEKMSQFEDASQQLFISGIVQLS